MGRMKKILLVLLSLALYFPTQGLASNLKQVLQDAFDNDPTFKQARAVWLANEQNLPIAKSALLPQLGLVGQLYRNNYSITGPTLVSDITGTRTDIVTQKIGDTGGYYQLSATQTLFNYGQWAAVKNAKAIVKQAVAAFDAAFQDLITRTADAYFLVLNASDNLRYKKAQEKQLANNLEQNRERYKVGLIAVTDVYDSQAEYERVVAERIEAENNLENNLESLRVITGKIYPQLQGPSDSLPLISPQPQNIERWVEVAQKQNYTLWAAYYAAQAAKEQISVEFGQGMPTLYGGASYKYQRDTNANVATLDTGNTTQRTPQIDLNLDYPIYQGGLTLAKTRQANYIYQQLDAEKEKTLRIVIADTRKSYLGVIASISQVRAYRQSVISNESALESSRAGYLVGTKTILDVLIAQSKLYENQRSYSENQYTYLKNILSLKKAAGTLGTKDVEEMNSWLDRKASFKESYLVKHAMGQEEKLPAMDHASIPSPKLNLPKDTSNKNKKAHLKEQPHENKRSYSIQLFSSSSEKEAQDFIQIHRLKDKVSCIRSKYKGQWRYRVFYGKYPTYQDAQSAFSQLSEELKQFKPLIKKL